MYNRISNDETIKIVQELIEKTNQISHPKESANYQQRQDFHEELRIIWKRTIRVLETTGLPYNLRNKIESHELYEPGNSELSNEYKTNIYIKEKKKVIDWLVEILDELRLSKALSEEYFNMMEDNDVEEDNNSTAKTEVRLGDGTTVYGNVVIASSVRDSFNKVTSAEIPTELKDLLLELSKNVAKMSAVISEESAEQVVRDLEILTAEATSTAPRKQWLELSVEGLKKAAENVGAIGEPVLKLVALILPLLQQ